MGIDRQHEDDKGHCPECDALALGRCSHAEGYDTQAFGDCSHTEGRDTVANGDASHAEGSSTISNGDSSHAEGIDTKANGVASHAEGVGTTAHGDHSHAEGNGTVAMGGSSHAEGTATLATGDSAHAEGTATKAEGKSAHAEGFLGQAIGFGSHAEGINTIASSEGSHAEGVESGASGVAAHAEGINTLAAGEGAHAEGMRTNALGACSHAEGMNTTTQGYEGAHIMGQNGAAEADYSWFLANGTTSCLPGLAAKILGDGRGFADLGWYGGGADYAEMFETLDGQSIEPGYFVTLDGEKIRKATAADEYVLGVVSATPAVLADSSELRWRGKYVTDEWGRIEYHEVVLPPVVNAQGTHVLPPRTKRQPIIHPDWDASKPYVPRLHRAEWIAVGLLGKLLVRDDGTCQVNGYCRPGRGGVATSAPSGYRVMKRTGANQILILFR